MSLAALTLTNNRSRATALILEIDIRKRLADGIADDEASVSSTDQGGGKRRGRCTPEESPRNRQGRRAPLPDRVGVFNRERENGIRRSSIRAAWVLQGPCGKSRLRPVLADCGPVKICCGGKRVGATHLPNPGPMPSSGRVENTRRTLLPSLLPNAGGKAEMETDDERCDLREMPTTWDV